VDNDGRIRASDADREKAVELLRGAYTEGRLTLAEFDERTTAAYAAKTWSALRELTSDLPTRVQLGPASDAPVPADPVLPPEFGSGGLPPGSNGRRFFPVPLVPLAVLAFLAMGGHAVLLVPVFVIVFVWLRMISRHNHHGPDHHSDGPPPGPDDGPF
jgi:hypothetical protein